MPAIGSNLTMKNPKFIWGRVLTKWFCNRVGPERKTATRYSNKLTADDGTTSPRPANLLVKAGVPATNTAADCPTGINDLCWDETNDKLYICTAYTNSTTFTWLKIID